MLKNIVDDVLGCLAAYSNSSGNATNRINTNRFRNFLFGNGDLPATAAHHFHMDIISHKHQLDLTMLSKLFVANFNDVNRNAPLVETIAQKLLTGFPRDTISAAIDKGMVLDEGNGMQVSRVRYALTDSYSIIETILQMNTNMALQLKVD